MRAETEPWWHQAEADLRAAEALFPVGEYHAVSWHAQQAAEKALKALIVERSRSNRPGNLPPRTHDLRYLGRRVGVPASIRADLALLFPLSQTARYPDDQTGLAPWT